MAMLETVQYSKRRALGDGSTYMEVPRLFVSCQLSIKLSARRNQHSLDLSLLEVVHIDVDTI
jgi:hypothetical protein